MSELYCFGQFTLDPIERRLYSDGRLVSLGSTALRILQAFVENAGEIITKDSLKSLVWDQPTSVTDNVLYVHISALRKALGDDCITNQQSRGYCFVTPVRRLPVPAGNLSKTNSADTSNRLIGRDRELRLISELFTGSRLVTLTGHGGVGKTKLALQVASLANSRFSDGIWLVELAPLENGELVPSAVVSSLGVRSGVSMTSIDMLTGYLARKSLLIVLDNCEHVIDAAARTTEAILRAAPKVKILATSRQPLSCNGEQIMEVLPLALPREEGMAASDLRTVAAVELFLERARQADANFQVDEKELPFVVRICRRVDGLPLAIEMAAGWAGVLGLEVLEDKLKESLDAWLCARATAPTRHSNLRATLAWSYDLLCAAEQSVLCRLAVFTSNFTMDAAEAVVAQDIIPKRQIFEVVASLIRKSLISVLPDSQAPRFQLLETTRAFMREELERSGGAPATRRRHAFYVLQVIEQGHSEFEVTSDAAWLERYGPILDDLRSALDWAMNEEVELAVTLAAASWPLWRELSLRSEGRKRLGAAVTLVGPETPSGLEAQLRCGLWEMWANTEALKTVHAGIERAVALYRELGEPAALGSALTRLGFSLAKLGQFDEAEKAILEAINLLEPETQLRTLATTYNALLVIDGFRGRPDSALIAGEKSARLCEAIGADRTGFVVAANLAELHLARGDTDATVSAIRSATSRLRRGHCPDMLGLALGILAAALVARGDLDEAAAVAREAVPLLRDEGRLPWLFDHLALRAALDGQSKNAALIAGYSNAIHKELGCKRDPIGRTASERTSLLLQDALTDDEIAEFGWLGARLSEGQAVTIALNDQAQA